MRWLLATRSGAIAAFKDGILRNGDTYELLDPTAWQDTFFRPCDVAVVFGIRENEQAFLRSAKRRSVPTAVVDLGYVHRLNHGQTQIEPDQTLCLSYGDWIGWVPQFTCPDDRRVKLGLQYPGCANKPDGDVLVMGQWPTDPTHPFSDGQSLQMWVEELRKTFDGLPVKYRPHPRFAPSDEFIEDAMWKARCVVTYSSNSGHDALSMGIPVITAQGPYRELCCPLDDPAVRAYAEVPTFPDEASWCSYFNRLAYAQWSFREFATGEPHKFLKSVVAGEHHVEEHVGRCAVNVVQLPAPKQRKSRNATRRAGA